jgi:hypothetical protein
LATLSLLNEPRPDVTLISYFKLTTTISLVVVMLVYVFT